MKFVQFVPLALWSLIGFCSAIATAQNQPLKVFLLAGQSNMQGHAHVRTFDAIGMDPETAPLLKDMRAADGTHRVCDQVWISSIGSSESEKTGQLTVGFGAEQGGTKIGPEFTFGIYMQQALDEPILIIKTAWGGKSLNTDFRPPSAGPYQFNPQQLEQFEKQEKDLATIQADKDQATGHYYRLMIEHVKHVLSDIQRVYPDYDPDQGYQLAGFVWFQGWNDMVDGGTYPERDQPGGYDQYSKLMTHFIRDVRNDLNSPELPFVIGVMGVNGPTDLYATDQQRYKSTHQNFRDAMAAPAALPEFQDNVVAVLTEKYWDQEVTELRRRENQLKQQIKQINQEVEAGSRTADEGKLAVDQLYVDEFSEREMFLLQNSVSNAEYHYMGSAKIMAQIGKGFADGMVTLIK